ncbi:CBU_0592 family membrane protein [Lutibacter sp.]
MNTIDWLGFVGVFLILLAYILNVTNKITSKSLLFISLNLVGASIACLASVLLNYIPFVILEGIWALISFLSFIKYLQQKNKLVS